MAFDIPVEDLRVAASALFDGLREEYYSNKVPGKMNDGVAVLLLDGMDGDACDLCYHVLTPDKSLSTTTIKNGIKEIVADHPTAQTCMIGFFVKTVIVDVEEDNAEMADDVWFVSMETADGDMLGFLARYRKQGETEEEEKWVVDVIRDVSKIEAEQTRFGYVLPINKVTHMGSGRA